MFSTESAVGNIQQSQTESRYIYKYVHRTHETVKLSMSTPLWHKWVTGVEFYSFLTSAINGGEWTASWPQLLDSFTHRIEGLVGPKTDPDCYGEEKSACPCQ